MMESHVQKVVIVLGNETQELEINKFTGLPISNIRFRSNQQARKCVIESAIGKKRGHN
jgi:hypothetical protein